jgi:hypothetical protein
MPAFNDCRCQKCNTQIGWLGELSDPPPCPNCGHKGDYSDTKKKIDEARNALFEVWELERLAKIERSSGKINTADDLLAKARALRKQHNIV